MLNCLEFFFSNLFPHFLFISQSGINRRTLHAPFSFHFPYLCHYSSWWWEVMNLCHHFFWHLQWVIGFLFNPLVIPVLPLVFLCLIFFPFFFSSFHYLAILQISFHPLIYISEVRIAKLIILLWWVFKPVTLNILCQLTWKSQNEEGEVRNRKEAKCC